MAFQNFRFIFEIIIAIVLVAVFAVWISNFINLESGFTNRLGVFAVDTCSGSLTLNVYGKERCTVKGQVLTSECYGKKYQIRENDCSGSLLYEDRVLYDHFQSTFSWFTLKGTHKYVLCVDGKIKDSGTLTCE